MHTHTKKHITVCVVVAGAVGIAGFFTGFWYAHRTQLQSPSANQGMRTGQDRQGRPGLFGFGRGNGGQIVAGEIISQDANSITVQMQSGGSKIVLISSSTPITKSAPATSAQLQPHQYVMTAGTANPDGSVTAQAIQIRPTPNK